MGHQRWGDGTKQQKSSVALAVGINGCAQSWKNCWPLLRFIKDNKLVAGGNLLPFQINPKLVGRLL